MVITDPEWLPARSGPPVLFLPDTRRTVVAKLRLLLQEGEVSFGSRPRDLEEMEELLSMLQVSAAVQVKKTNILCLNQFLYVQAFSSEIPINNNLNRETEVGLIFAWFRIDTNISRTFIWRSWLVRKG